MLFSSKIKIAGYVGAVCVYAIAMILVGTLWYPDETEEYVKSSCGLVVCNITFDAINGGSQGQMVFSISSPFNVNYTFTSDLPCKACDQDCWDAYKSFVCCIQSKDESIVNSAKCFYDSVAFLGFFGAIGFLILFVLGIVLYQHETK